MDRVCWWMVGVNFSRRVISNGSDSTNARWKKVDAVRSAKMITPDISDQRILVPSSSTTVINWHCFIHCHQGGEYIEVSSAGWD